MNTTYIDDQRVVLTLDAGGTNFVFSAIRGNEEIILPVTVPAETSQLKRCLKIIVEGFQQCWDQLQDPPSAISFAFPGPADYPAGIIGDLPNLPAFRGGVPLGPYLKQHFNIPVFINNDGNLFALGESISGLLPKTNRLLASSDSPKRFDTLLGITIGTGFGGGIVIRNQMIIGDNSAAGEIWLLRHPGEKDNFAEEGVSIRSVKRNYSKYAGIDPARCPEPKEIYRIATEKREGNTEAAQKAFKTLGTIVGESVANAVTLLDGLVVVGGGLSRAYSLILPEMVNVMNGKIGGVNRLEVKAFNLEDPDDLYQFIRGETTSLPVPGSNKTVSYDGLQRIGVGVSVLGTSRATGIGAYAFALQQLDQITV